VRISKIPLDMLEDYLKSKDLKERTIQNYIYYFYKFTSDKFNQETVSRFLAKPENRNSVARSFLVNFQKFLMVNRTELNLTSQEWEDVANVELPKLTGRKKKRIINPIPHDQIPLLERALPSEKLKLQLLLSYYAGLRLGELLKISIMSFDWDKWKKDPSKMGECRVFGKGDKEGIALFPSELMKRVARYIKKGNFNSIDDKLFIKGKQDLTAMELKNRGRTWQKRIKEAGIKSGITKRDADGRLVPKTITHPHRLRHSYASYLLNVKGLNMKEVQEVLRHTDISSTQIYTHIDKTALKEKLSS